MRCRVVALHNLLPRSRVARDTAAYQHGGELRVFQTFHSLGTPGFDPAVANQSVEPLLYRSLNTTHQIRVYSPKSSCIL